jgi:hypothetical protein
LFEPNTADEDASSADAGAAFATPRECGDGLSVPFLALRRSLCPSFFSKSPNCTVKVFYFIFYIVKLFYLL